MNAHTYTNTKRTLQAVANSSLLFLLHSCPVVCNWNRGANNWAGNIKSGGIKDRLTQREGDTKERESWRGRKVEEKCVREIINLPVCVCVYISVHAHICLCVCSRLYVYFPRSLLKARREGEKLTRPVDNDVSPARNTTLKGTAQLGHRFAG